MDEKLYASGSSVLKLTELTKNALNEHEARLKALDSLEDETITCDNRIADVPSSANRRLTLQEVKGKTVQNVSPVKANKNGFYYVDVNNLHYVSYKGTVNNGSYSSTLFNDGILFKPNTKYTVLYQATADTSTDGDVLRGSIIFCESNQYVGDPRNYSEVSFANNTPKVIEVPEGMPYCEFRGLRSAYAHTLTGHGFRFLILEGDYTSTISQLPYFEGIKSVQDSVQIKSIGKNIFKLNDRTIHEYDIQKFDQSIKKPIDGNSIFLGFSANNYWDETNIGHFAINSNSIELKSGNGAYGIGIDCIIKPSTSYTLSWKVNVHDLVSVTFYDKEVNILSWINQLNGKQFTTPSNAYYCIIDFKRSDNNTSDTLVIYSDVMLEEGATATAYEPYQETTMQIPLTEPLRSLPNGVCDYIKDGKIVRNIGKIVIDGSEAWYEIGVSSSGYYYYISSVIDKLVKVYKDTNMICDKFRCDNTNYLYIEGANAEKIGHGDGQHMIRVSTLKATTLNDWKTWLNSNNLTIYYELATPIIEDIPLPNDGILTAYPNGHVLIENTPIFPTATFEFKSGLKGAISQLQVGVEEHQRKITDMLVESTGEQVVDKRANDLVIQDGTIKLEEMKGNTVQNIASALSVPSSSVYKAFNTKGKISFTTTKENTAEHFGEFGEHGQFAIDRSKTYSLVMDISKNTLSGDAKFNVTGTYAKFAFNGIGIPSKTTGRVILNLQHKTSHTLASNSLWLTVGTELGCLIGEQFEANFMILEGDWTGKEIPAYFTGIKSVNEEQTGLQVRSVGKNLFNMKNATFPETSTAENITDNEFTISNNGNTFAYANIVIKNLKPYTTYTISFHSELISGSNTAMNTIYGHNVSDNKQMSFTSMSHSGNTYREFKFTTSYDKDIRFYVYASTTVTDSIKVRYYNFQLEKGDTKTPYEPYKESAITIPYAEPLRRLPNGVADTIEDGKVIRRVGKGVLDGSESWYIGDSSSGWKVSDESVPMYCDKFNSVAKGFEGAVQNTGIADILKHVRRNDVVGTAANGVVNVNNGYTAIRVAGVTTSEQLKSWLSNNPVTVYFELATPIIEEIPEITLYGYKHLIFDNDITPEATISFAESNYSRLVALEETNVAQSKTIAELCAMVDALTLQIGNLL